MSELAREIKQNVPFSSVEEEVFLNLQKTAYEIRQKGDRILQQFDLTGQQYNVLRILRGAGSAGISFSEISERLIFKDSDITRLMNRLESREVILVSRSEEDRRVKIAAIGEPGLELLAKLDQPISNAAVEQLSHLGEPMLQQLNALLVLARGNI